jgi:hypothetical protein
MGSFWGHLSTITRHRHKVMLHCFKAGIFWQGLRHDLSKYSLEEFFAGVKYYQGYRSPNESEREVKGYSRAWMHHKGRNKHHFEYWTDYSPKERKMIPVKMPLKYVVEMFCDRVAASKIYGGDKYDNSYALNYFLKGKDTRVIHPETSKLIEDLLTMLANEGEKATFKHIRKLLKNKEY